MQGRFRTGRHRSWTGLLLAMPLLAPAQAPPVTDGPDAVPRLTLEGIDYTLESARSMGTRLAGDVANREPDHTGRTVEQDLQEWHFAPPVRERIAALRAALPATIPQGSDTVPHEALAPLMQVLDTEFCHYAIISAYWQSRDQAEYHRRMILALRERAPEEQRADIDAELEPLPALHRAMRELMPGAMAACDGMNMLDSPVVRQMGRMLNEYNTVRSRVAQRIDTVAPQGHYPSVQRDAACPAPATATTGRAMPALRIQPELDEFYPAASRLYGVSGRTVVRVVIDATGCVTTVSVHGSSGSTLLDEAAIRFAFALAFTPGEAQGKPVGGAFLQPVNFYFGTPDSAATQPQP